MDVTIRVITEPEQMHAVVNLQNLIWSGGDNEAIPIHMMIAAIRHGGLLIGAYVVNEQEELVGFVFGFPGFYKIQEGFKWMHCSHVLGVHPDYRDKNIGFRLKRAQWQLVRNQGVERITWTYDPLLCRNAYFNIAKLGAICNTYEENYYGKLNDQINLGLPTDRFHLDWWVNTERVYRRLSKKVRRKLDLAHFLAAGAEIYNPSVLRNDGLAMPFLSNEPIPLENHEPLMLLIEIPDNFLEIKSKDNKLALEWRYHTRKIFTNLFSRGYLITDFIYLSGNTPRGFYVLTQGESTL